MKKGDEEVKKNRKPLTVALSSRRFIRCSSLLTGSMEIKYLDHKNFSARESRGKREKVIQEYQKKRIQHLRNVWRNTSGVTT